MARAASVPGLWALGFLLLACVGGWHRVAVGRGFCFHLPVVLGSWVGVFGLGLCCCPSFAGCLWCSWLGFGVGPLSERVWFRGRFPCPPPFPVPVCGVGMRAGPGSRLCPALLAGLSGCVFCAFFFFGCWVSPSRALWSLPPSPFFSAGLLAFFFFVGVCLFRCPFSRWAAVPGLVLPVFAGWSPCACLGVLSSVPSGWGVWPPSVFLAGGLVTVGSFRAAHLFPPPPFFFLGGGGWLFLPLPSLGWRLLCGWCVVWLVPRQSWRRFLCATPRQSWLGFAAGGGGRSPPLLAGVRWRWWCVVCGVWRWCVGGVVAGVWCGWSLATPGGGSCALLPATPGWVSLPLVVGGPRHSWLGSVGGVAVWCVVCGGGVLVGLWLVCGVVGPSPLLAEVPVCYSPPLLAGFRCRWWWAVPATPGWSSLAAVVCGVWCVVCGVWRWCVGGVVAGVWCGWSLATPGGGSFVLLPATPGWVSLPVVVGGPRHSWLGSVGGGGVWCVVCGVLVGSLATPGGGSCVLLPATPGWVSLPLVVGGPRHSWLGSAGGGGVWCVVCGVWRWCVVGVVFGVWCGWSLATPGGGPCVLLPATPGWVSLPVVVGGPRHSWLGSVGGGGLWCVVCWWGPSPLLVEVPVCYSPPFLVGFRCRWLWAVPATPGWGPLAAVPCGVWCVAVVCCSGCGWCVVWLVPRHSWRRSLCATPRHSWLGFAAGGDGRSPPLLAGVRWRRWSVVCGVLVGSLATPGGGSCVLLPATPGWISLPLVVGGPRHSWLGSAGGGAVWCVVCGGGVLFGLWLVCGVVGPSPLLAVVPVCYSPPLLAGFRCWWWWAVPATPGWGPLAAVVCGVWCVVCWWGPSSLLAEVLVCYSPPLLAGFRCRWWWAVPATPGWGPLAAVVCGVWCVVYGGGVLLGLWLVCGVVGPSPLLAEVPVCYSPPLLAGFRCWWWWAVAATPGWGPLAAVVCGVWCVGGVPRHSWRRFLCATPRHSWLGFAAAGGGRCPPLLAGVRWRRCRVVCGVWRWCVVRVVVGVWCGWSLTTPGGGPCVLLPATPGWVSLPVVVGGPRHSWLGSVGGGGVWCVVYGVLVGSLVTPGGGSCVLLPATPGWVSLPLVVGGPRHSWLGSAGGGGVWCVVCRVWRWCVVGVVVGVWCGWSLATPGGGPCVLLPATPGWVSLPVVVGGPRHSWLGSVGGSGLWCVVCWWGPSPLLAEVPVCYSPPLLAGFRCRWWWAVPATPGWGPLAAVPCGVWCVAVVCCSGCGWCVVWLVPRHSWRWSLCATPRHSWLGFAAGGGGRSPPLLAGVRWRRCPVVCGVWRWCVVPVVVGVWCGWSLATPGGGSCVLLPATPGWISLPLVVGGPRHSWLGSAGGGGVWCVVCGVWRWCVVGVVVGVWCGWSLATPGGGPCVLLPATPGWVSLPVVVGGPGHSWLGSVGSGGLWCVVCWWGPSPLLAEVPVCYSPPLLAGFRCRWWWAVPATPGWGPLAAVPCGVCSCACFAWAGRAGRPPGHVLVCLTFSFGRFVFLLCLAPSGPGLPLSLSLLLPFLVGCFSRPPAAWLSVRSRLVCVSRLAVGCSLVGAPPPPSPFVSRGFRRSCLVPWCFCFFFLPPSSSASVRPSCLRFSLVSGPGCPRPRRLRCLLCLPSVSGLSVRLLLFRAFRLVVGCSRVVAAPPPPPLCFAVFVPAARCCVPCCAVLPWVRCCAALLRVVSPGVLLSCAVLCSCGAAACCAVPSGAARRPGALCSAALCFAVFPRAVCVLSWRGGACCCSPLCLVLCVSRGAVLCVPCALRSVRCCASLCWCTRVVLIVWCVLLLAPGAVVRCCVLCCFLWCAVVPCSVWWLVVVCWWRVSVSVSLSGRVVCSPVVGVVCCGALLSCVVFCGAVLSRGAVLLCSAVAPQVLLKNVPRSPWVS